MGTNKLSLRSSLHAVPRASVILDTMFPYLSRSAWTACNLECAFLDAEHAPGPVVRPSGRVRRAGTRLAENSVYRSSDSDLHMFCDK